MKATVRFLINSLAYLMLALSDCIVIPFMGLFWLLAVLLEEE